MFIGKGCLRGTGSRSTVLLLVLRQISDHTHHVIFVIIIFVILIILVILFINSVSESYFLKLVQLTFSIFWQYTAALAGAWQIFGLFLLAKDFNALRVLLSKCLVKHLFTSNLLMGRQIENIWPRLSQCLKRKRGNSSLNTYRIRSEFKLLSFSTAAIERFLNLRNSSVILIFFTISQT